MPTRLRVEIHTANVITRAAMVRRSEFRRASDRNRTLGFATVRRTIPHEIGYAYPDIPDLAAL